MSAENSTGLPVSGQITLETAEDTEAFGRRLAAGLVAGDLVVLDGPTRGRQDRVDARNRRRARGAGPGDVPDVRHRS